MTDTSNDLNVRRELSSRYTPMYRWVIPALLTVAAIGLIWRAAETGEQETMKIVIAVLEAAVCMIVARWLDRAKRVHIDAEYLYISDFRRDTKVPLTNIDRVSTTVWLKPHRIMLHFKQPTIFGDWIVFFPAHKWPNLFRPSPIADELQQIVADKNGNSGSA